MRGVSCGKGGKKKIDKQTILSCQAYEWSWPERMNVTHKIDKKDERRRRQSRTYVCMYVYVYEELKRRVMAYNQCGAALLDVYVDSNHGP